MILLQFCGSQDLQAFGRVCEAMNDLDESWSGGSHEFRLLATNDGKIVITDEFDHAKNDNKKGVAK